MISYQTDGVEMPAIKKAKTQNGLKPLLPLTRKESVKSPIFSVLTRKYLR